MRSFIIVALFLAPFSAAAESYARPIPQAQSATAEFWFLIASLSLIFALWVVHKLVSRR